MFEMAHAVPGSKRQYDWANKILISLRPLELAQIIRQPQQEHTFYHDTCEQGVLFIIHLFTLFILYLLYLLTL